MTPEYAAGFFDGEGCVTFHRHRCTNGRYWMYRLICTVGQTDRAVLDLLALHYGGVVVRRKQRQTNWRRPYVWTVHSAQAIRFIRAIQPFCLVKQAQLLVASEFWAFHSSARRDRYDYVAGDGKKAGRGPTWNKRPATIQQELNYRRRLSVLNQGRIAEDAA